MWGTALWGDLLSARGILDRSRASGEGAYPIWPEDRPFYMSLAPRLPGSPRAYLSHDLFCLGYLDQARLRSEQAVDEARDLGHAFGLARAWCFAAGATADLLRTRPMRRRGCLPMRK